MRLAYIAAAAALTVLWLLVSLPGLTRHHDPLLAANPTVQLASLLALAIGAAVLIRSQHSLQATIRRIS